MIISANPKSFKRFLIKIDGLSEAAIKAIMKSEYIDTPGNYQEEKKEYDDVEDYYYRNMGSAEFSKLHEYYRTHPKQVKRIMKLPRHY